MSTVIKDKERSLLGYPIEGSGGFMKIRYFFQTCFQAILGHPEW